MKIDESEKLKSLLKEAEDSPFIKKILAEKAKETLKKRREVADKIEVLKKDRDATIPNLQTNLTEKEEQSKKAKEKYDATIAELQKAKTALSSQSFQFSHQISLLKDQLFETADEKIDEAIEFFNKKLKFMRDPGRIRSNALGAEKNFFSMKKKVKAESNYDAVISAMRYCQESIKALEAMRLKPKLDPEKIEGLKNGIPNIDTYTESVGEKRII